MPEGKRNSPVNPGISADVPAFVQGLAFADLPADVVAQAQRCLLDLIGVAAAGSRTSAAQIVNNYAATQLRSSETEARMLFGGRRTSPAGAAFAGATTIDSFDAHDGHVLVEGHAGVVVLLTAGDGRSWRLRRPQFITALVLGTRSRRGAGIASARQSCEAHCSGWNAIACAACCGALTRAMRRSCTHWASPNILARAVSWYGSAAIRRRWSRTVPAPGRPRSDRCARARRIHRGAALTVERTMQSPTQNDLGSRWRIREQYQGLPRMPMAQPAIKRR
jgi:hypothetical protein